MQLWQFRRHDLLVPLSLSFWPRALLLGGLLLGTWVYWQPVAPPFLYFQF
jgi:hypothetical protein